MTDTIVHKIRPAKIMEIQRVPRATGFNPSPVNAEPRTATMAAVNAFQQSRGLPVGGLLKPETVKALGVTSS